MKVQDLYEEQLSAHWQKLYQIKELEATNSGSYLRIKSITDRKYELALIEEALRVLDRLVVLDVPDWYKERIKELG